jgi:hypothetical protein
LYYKVNNDEEPPMQKIFSTSKRIHLTSAPSFNQTFAVYAIERGFRVFVEGRMVVRHSINRSGLYTAEGVQQIAAHYGFTVPVNKLV